MNQLAVSRGPLKGARFTISPGKILRIGRDQECELWVADRLVSRFHAQVMCDAGGAFTVCDLGSSNGTRVDGTRIEAQLALRIEPGTRIEIGETELVLLEEADESVAAESPERLPVSVSEDHLGALLEFQVQVAEVVEWGAAAALLYTTAARLLPENALLTLVQVIDWGEGFAPWEPPSSSATLLPLPDPALLTRALRTGKPQALSARELIVPLPPGTTAPIRALHVSGVGPEHRELLSFLVQATARSPALRPPEEDRGLPRAEALGIVGESAPIRRVLAEVGRAAATDDAVLILGETGAGKELVARAIHQLSPRAQGPFVPVNAAAISPELLESELFGHEQGSFTGAQKRHRGFFEQAADGTLFLDEIGELPLSAQAKLLRVLDYGEIRRVGGEDIVRSKARVVCATNRSFQAEIQSERFRPDLYYRIAGQIISIPPLRQRREDIPLLFKHFLKRSAGELGGSIPTVSEEAMARLLAHSWPGNVRELAMFVRRLVAGFRGQVVTPDVLPFGGGESLGAADPADPESAATVRVTSLREVEREHIVAVFDACGRNQSKAAGVLGITRRTLYSKLKQFGEL